MGRFQDINLNELNLKEQYYNEFLGGNINKAQQIIKDNIELKDKVISAENLNNLILSIIKLEQNYNTYFVDNLNKKKNIYQVNINDLIYLKEFQNSKQYEINNFVLYNKEVYFCKKKAPVGTLPTNSTYWVYLGLKGEIGAKSLGIRYKDSWNNNITYAKFDMVVYQNKLYVSKTTNKGKIPKTSLVDWELVMSVASSKITVQKETPQLNNKEIWFQIL